MWKGGRWGGEVLKKAKIRASAEHDDILRDETEKKP